MFKFLALSFLCISGAIYAAEKPNVIMIAVDDLNDWVGCLKGHPQALTPNIDRLASSGTLFANAHCQSPVCEPSRSSLMVSKYPSSTGIYFLSPDHLGSEVSKNLLTIPQRFAQEGYSVMGGGKLFHSKLNKTIFSKVGEYFSDKGGFGPLPKKRINYFTGTASWDWGAYPDKDEQMPDFQTAQWAVKKIASQKADKPFLLCVGFYRPHVPLYVPKKWFDMFPLDKIQLPEVKENDNADISKYAHDLTNLEHIAPTQKWMLENNQWAKAVQAYLASIAFADSCVGQVLDALDKSPLKDNTIVVLFSDHGFHMGEKERWAKRSIWEDGTRVPLIISSKNFKPGQVSKRPVGLIDLYPTLLDMCGLEADKAHEGQTIAPLLAEPEKVWERPVRSTFGKGNNSIRSTRWRYIKYVDGSEELYDHENDPNEWNNLANNPEYSAIIREHAVWLPKADQEAEILGKGSTGHNAYNAAAKELEKTKK